MRTIIAGSRSVHHFADLESAISKIDWKIESVICGEAKGADLLGKQWAKIRKIPIDSHPADWDTYGKSAGYIRNAEMAKNADALIALWDGKSPGTKSMIDLAIKQGLRVHVEEAKFKPTVLNKYKHGLPPGSVYIGRPSKFGNPFAMGKDGTREEVIQLYKDWLWTQPDLIAEIKTDLIGKDLVCYCAPCACHGDVLLEIANS